MIYDLLDDSERFINRCYDVFCLEDTDTIYGLKRIDGDTLVIRMSEYDEIVGYDLDFDYYAYMGDRPEALDYLLGKRDNFND